MSQKLCDMEIVYAYTYSDKAMGNTFENYLQKVEWDATARKWKFTKQDGRVGYVIRTKL